MLRKGHVLVILVIGVSLFTITSLAYAATDNMSAKVQNFKVSEKANYNVIFVDVLFTVPNIEMGDLVLIPHAGFKIENEKGKSYRPDPNECAYPATLSYTMTGKTGPEKSFTICFSVEKQFKTFKVFYTPQYQKPIQIGVVDLNAESKKPASNEGNQCVRLMTQAEKDAKPNRIQDGIPGIMQNGECVTDKSKLAELRADSNKTTIQDFDIAKFFSDLIDQIRSLFSF